MAYIKRNCECCNKEYLADERNIKRGWGLTCSKSCAAKKREKSKPNYNADRVAKNNVRRLVWNDVATTSEGYRIIDGIAYDEFDEPMYRVKA